MFNSFEDFMKATEVKVPWSRLDPCHNCGFKCGINCNHPEGPTECPRGQ